MKVNGRINHKGYQDLNHILEMLARESMLLPFLISSSGKTGRIKTVTNEKYKRIALAETDIFFLLYSKNILLNLVKKNFFIQLFFRGQSLR